MVWEFIGNIAIFLLVWFGVFFFHEVCHLSEAYRQTGNWGYVRITLFTMRAIPQCIIDRPMFLLAGGLYSGLTAIGIGCLVSHPILQFSLFSIGLTNVVYSFFERQYLGVLDSWEYLKGRYGIYGFVIGCCILFRFSGWFM